jgi:hypothetical protein
MGAASSDKSPRGRGRLSAFDLLPPECEPLLTAAAHELGDRNRTQLDIYADFIRGCEEIMAASRGELEFAIPSFSSFNRLSIRLARLTRRLDQTRQIVAAIADKFDAKESDDLTVMLGETIKSLILHMLAEGDDVLGSKEVMQLANAFKSALQAQSISSDRRRKVEAEFEGKVTEAVERAAKATGMSAETAEAVKAQILGVTG